MHGRVEPLPLQDLEEFRQSIFAFGCGGRIKGLFGTEWAEADALDRGHVCSRDRVFEHCIDWPRKNRDLFDNIVQKIIFFAVGAPADAEAHWQAFLKREEADADFEEPAAGPGATEAPAKKSAR